MILHLPEEDKERWGKGERCPACYSSGDDG